MDSERIGRLRSAVTNLSRRLNITAAQSRLTPAQTAVLGATVSQGRLSLSRLVEIEGMHPTMLSRVVGRLAADGLIDRRPNPADLRSVTVSATRAGRAAHGRVCAAKIAVLEACVARLDPEHQLALVAAIPALEALAVELQRRTKR